jgi:hypothetical protein
MRLVKGFGRFWFDFIVGDDWRIAAGVVSVLALGALLVGSVADELLAVMMAAGVVAVVLVSLLFSGYSRRTRP